jgi:hypothetical protein
VYHVKAMRELQDRFQRVGYQTEFNVQEDYMIVEFTTRKGLFKTYVKVCGHEIMNYPTRVIFDSVIARMNNLVKENL